MHIETKTIQLSHSVCFDLFFEDPKGRICTKMTSFFPRCKTKPVIWQAGKNKKTITYCLLRKNYIAKNEYPLFYETIFRYELETDVNNVMKKNKIQYVLKMLLFKTIIYFSSIYFESHCKIPAQSNKSVQ